MSKRRIILPVAVMMMASYWLGTKSAGAQQVPTGKTPPSATSVAAAKKAAILSSQGWQDLKAEFHQWLSAQVVLTPRQVEQMKAKLDAEVHTMSAAELQQFLDQWNAKLKILLGKDAVEAREWLAQNLVVMADGYRSKFLKELGLVDVSDMTAAQIEQKILEIRAKRISMREQRAFFDTTRKQMVQAAHETHAEWRLEDQRADDEAASAPQVDPYQSQYSPRPRENYPQRYQPAYGGPFGGYRWGYVW